MPTTCCRCNGSGRCRNCSCVKAQRQCTNCLPKRKGTCSNTNSPHADDVQQLEQQSTDATILRREPVSQPTFIDAVLVSKPVLPLPFPMVRPQRRSHTLSQLHTLKLYTGGRKFVLFPLGRLARHLLVNWQGCLELTPKGQHWKPLPSKPPLLCPFFFCKNDTGPPSPKSRSSV